MTNAQVRAFSRALRAWYRRWKRPLPWRATRDPYAIWISEVMLQQTTVAAAEPRWHRFLARFPDVASLAAADESEVLAEWSGLGYYARGRNLHRAARVLAARGGGLPRSVAALRALPGVGPYTAAAVASIAFGVRAAAVDGNAARVLARVLAARDAPGRVANLAERLVPARSAGEHTQALMELGAVLCAPRAPRCESCPVRRFCRAARAGHPERFPSPRPRHASQRLRLAAGVARRRGGLVVVEDRELVRGHVVVPLARVASGEEAAAALRGAWRDLAGREPSRVERVGVVRHTVLSRRYEVEVFRVVEGAGRARGVARVIALTDLSVLPHGGLLRKVLVLAKVSTAP
ncbi:MAG TPA: A/G-specific adenine glycosylase [Thermoanaerobaculia bacterium]|nr:A/G-specific adenine glycosylase [Thermoanaerobaculia bacterium]